MKDSLEVGKIVEGQVSGIENYGIFITLKNGYNGLIHISEISKKFVNDINQYAQIGETIPCEIISVDNQQKKVRLSIKNLDYHLRREESDNKNFQHLKEMLPLWIEDKMKKINND